MKIAIEALKRDQIQMYNYYYKNIYWSINYVIGNTKNTEIKCHR